MELQHIVGLDKIWSKINNYLLFQAPCPDTYRGKYWASERQNEDMGLLYAKEVAGLLDKAKERGRKVAAFIAESLLSCGGQIILPENYLKNVYR